MALSQAEWSFDTLPVPSVSNATSKLSNEDTNAVSTHTLPVQAKSQSAELLEEVWMQILGLVSRSNPSSTKQILTYRQLNDSVDLLNLSLASKRMQALTTRLLYENFDLVLAPQMNNSFSRVLSGRNVGRDFMRRLTVSLDVEHDDDPRVPYQWLGVLLENLSPDKLAYLR
jgi:hypothetical protein